MKAIRTALMLAVTLAAGALDSFSTAAPAAPLTLREALMSERGAAGRKTGLPVIARYELDDGGVFILDRSTPRPLLKFDDSPEIWVLQAGAGPRGDVIYRNDFGDTMLRATKLGGMTVFTDRRPEGSAAALEGQASPLRVPPLGPLALYDRFYQASVRTTRAAQHPVAFETLQDAAPLTAGLLADAALVTTQALVSVAARPNGKALLSHLNDVVIAQGSRPGASLLRGVLTVTIVPAQGVAGRPSSRKIEAAASAR